MPIATGTAATSSAICASISQGRAPPVRSHATTTSEQAAAAAEHLGVVGVGAGPAGLDERDAEGVEPLRDAELVGAGERDALALRAVAQRGVVDRDAEVRGSCAHGR